MPDIFRLEHRSKFIDINSGRYTVSKDFVPPTINQSTVYAFGTSANRWGGGKPVSTKWNNRSFQVPIHIRVSTPAEFDRSLATLQSWLDLASDPDELYFVFKTNSPTSYEPKWGYFGSFLRLQIVSGEVIAPPRYGEAPLRSAGAPNAVLNLTIKPFAVGPKNRLASARAYVFEDRIGTPDGRSRGLVVSNAITNIALNPNFNAHADPLTNWTNTGLTIAEGNANLEYVLFGNRSAFLVAPAGTTGRLTQNLNLPASTHCFSVFVKKRDGGALTATDVRIHYNGSDLSPTFQTYPNGWNRIFATATGTGTSVAAGINVRAFTAVYADGYQVELGSFPSPYVHGDALGCNWNGTDQSASSDPDAAGWLRIPARNFIAPDRFTMRFALRMLIANTNLSADSYVVDGTPSSIQLRWDTAAPAWQAFDGTTTITGTADTFTFGQVVVLHLVGEPGRFRLYKNGAQIATSATFTPAALPTYFYFGSEDDQSDFLNCAFLDIGGFDRAMSDAEVLADFNAISSIISDAVFDGAASPVPFFWTLDGDDQVDNGLDSAVSNYFVAAGIPGNIPAETEIDMAVETGLDWDDVGHIQMSQSIMRNYHRPELVLFSDQSGTAGASYNGGAYKQVALGTTEIDLADFDINAQSSLRWLDLFGFEYYLVARFYDAGAGNIRLRSRLSLGTTLDEQIETDLQAISSTAADRLYILAPLPTWDPKRHYLNVHDDGITAQGSFILRGVRTTGSANVRIDYIAVAPRPFISIGESKIYTSPPTNVRLKGRIAAGYLESGGVQPDKFQKTLPVKGDEIEFWPQKFNSVMLFLGDESTAPAIGTSIDFDNVWIRPRWGLLT